MLVLAGALPASASDDCIEQAFGIFSRRLMLLQQPFPGLLPLEGTFALTRLLTESFKDLIRAVNLLQQVLIHRFGEDHSEFPSFTFIGQGNLNE